MTAPSEQSFEVVFYSEPVPSSLRTLAVLALVFDKVHFPGVYISEQVDAEATAAELRRIRELKPPPAARDNSQMLNCMTYALQRQHVADFCVFPGEYGYAGVLEEGAKGL